MQSREIGKCIYCGADEGRLTREHIIPAGLGGRNVLLRASCDEHAKVTSKFELDVLRSHLNNFRISYGIKRLPNGEPEPSIKLNQLDDNGEPVASFEVPMSKFPLPLVLPVFDPPRLLAPNQERHFEGTFGVWVSEPPSTDEPVSFDVATTIQPWSFIRLLAKTAHCAAVDQFGIDQIRSGLRDIILDQHQSGKYWTDCIGVATVSPPTKDRFLVEVFVNPKTMIIEVQIRFFSFLGAPTYSVVVGKLDADLSEFEQLPSSAETPSEGGERTTHGYRVLKIDPSELKRWPRSGG